MHRWGPRGDRSRVRPRPRRDGRRPRARRRCHALRGRMLGPIRRDPGARPDYVRGSRRADERPRLRSRPIEARPGRRLRWARRSRDHGLGEPLGCTGRRRRLERPCNVVGARRRRPSRGRCARRRVDPERSACPFHRRAHRGPRPSRRRAVRSHGRVGRRRRSRARRGSRHHHRARPWCGGGRRRWSRGRRRGGGRCGRLRRRRGRCGLRDRRRRSRNRRGGSCRRRRRSRGRLRRGRRSRARRKQAERIDVALRLRPDPDAEVDGRDRVLGVTTPAHRSDRRSLRDHVALLDADRAEVDERDRVAVGGEDRDAAAVGRERAGERHRAGGGRSHRRALRPGEVDAAVLSGGVRVAAERKGAEHVAVRRPRPRRGRAADHERRETRHREYEKTMHEAPPSFSARATRPTKGSAVVGRRQSDGVRDRR